MPGSYVPKRGDFIWLDFDPQAGHEQAGKRPALVLSGRDFNVKTGMALVAPITNTVRGGPFEIPLPAGMAVTGVILTHHAKILDWRKRNARRIGVASTQHLDEAVALLKAILDD